MADYTSNFRFELIAANTTPYHDEAHNNWHIVDAIFTRYLSLNDFQGVWQNSLAVTVGQRYVDSVTETIYEVLVAHTTHASNTFAQDRTNNSTYWQSVTVDVSFRGTWAESTVYAVNDFVVDTGRYGVVAVAHTAATSYDTGVAAGNIITLIDTTTIISSTHTTSTIAAGGTPTATYTQSTGKFNFGLVTGNTGATGATGTAGTDADVGIIIALG